MGKMILVRHGQDIDNSKGILNGLRDTELTDLGREQARKVAEKLTGYGIQVIYASPLKRAYDTACIIADVIGIAKVITEESLVERDFGILTGKPVSDIEKYSKRILPTDRVNYFLEAEGAEDFPTLLRRGRMVLQCIQEKHENENVLIVAHGDIGKMIRAAFHGWSWKQGLETPYLDNTGILELSAAQDVMS